MLEKVMHGQGAIRDRLYKGPRPICTKRHLLNSEHTVE
eukprot:CAMPEP_0178459986 /NCGR_PEP_ID=MMETSP0689_2-20121128/48436_1 /TAXON_ID=160604 /ORGANISM="Amphidinium massartii, Strain CS-259" /LENGTH=37 /DNA_ID= /DNA_START= /DNA_END= /DNA_ORIENTATION=